ncbi:hypothetical protein F383_13390 [Gossypium arboreum]|uniref:Uncharacterized protein n=1 Tax=Gossypium arboreum TaxID=29729 RepID=A0A0B0NC60_GOSAR|nr:hypothetical protein F383_13390 [Gossypium arboreum]
MNLNKQNSTTRGLSTFPDLILFSFVLDIFKFKFDLFKLTFIQINPKTHI